MSLGYNNCVVLNEEVVKHEPYNFEKWSNESKYTHPDHFELRVVVDIIKSLLFIELPTEMTQNFSKEVLAFIQYNQNRQLLFVLNSIVPLIEAPVSDELSHQLITNLHTEIVHELCNKHQRGYIDPSFYIKPINSDWDSLYHFVPGSVPATIDYNRTQPTPLLESHNKPLTRQTSEFKTDVPFGSTLSLDNLATSSNPLSMSAMSKSNNLAGLQNQIKNIATKNSEEQVNNSKPNFSSSIRESFVIPKSIHNILNNNKNSVRFTEIKDNHSDSRLLSKSLKTSRFLTEKPKKNIAQPKATSSAKQIPKKNLMSNKKIDSQSIKSLSSTKSSLSPPITKSNIKLDSAVKKG